MTCSKGRNSGLRNVFRRAARQLSCRDWDMTEFPAAKESVFLMQREKTLVCWSSGKDSALALLHLLEEGFQVDSLLVTVTEGFERVSMHGVRRLLLHRQARSLGMQICEVPIPPNCSNEEYEARMERVLRNFLDRGVRKVAFGDIFLEDMRAYRERNLAKLSMQAIFPLWGRSTEDLARTFVSLGFRAVVTCVDTQALDGRFCGREFDLSFLEELPQGIDPCGENGEFHTFVYAGPIFAHPVRFRLGRKVLREGRFLFCDLIPA